MGTETKLELEEFNRSYRVLADSDIDLHTVLDARLMEYLQHHRDLDLGIETGPFGLVVFSRGALGTDDIRTMLEFAVGIAERIPRIAGTPRTDEPPPFLPVPRLRWSERLVQSNWDRANRPYTAYQSPTPGLVGSSRLVGIPIYEVRRRLRDGSWHRSPATKRYLLLRVGAGLFMAIVIFARFRLNSPWAALGALLLGVGSAVGPLLLGSTSPPPRHAADAAESTPVRLRVILGLVAGLAGLAIVIMVILSRSQAPARPSMEGNLYEAIGQQDCAITDAAMEQDAEGAPELRTRDQLIPKPRDGMIVAAHQDIPVLPAPVGTSMLSVAKRGGATAAVTEDWITPRGDPEVWITAVEYPDRASAHESWRAFGSWCLSNEAFASGVPDVIAVHGSGAARGRTTAWLWRDHYVVVIDAPAGADPSHELALDIAGRV